MSPTPSSPTAGPSIPRFVPTQTERLTLRPVEAGDVDALHDRRNDPTTAQWQSWALPYPRDRAQALIDSVIECDGTPPGDGWFQVTVEETTSRRIVGDLAIHLTFQGRSAELGYTFAPDVRGAGFATEAAAELARWCIETVGVSRVSAQLHPENLASARVAERIGMTFEGHTKNSFWVDQPDGTSENSDDWIYAMTPDTWRRWTGRKRQRPSIVRFVDITHENVHSVLALSTHKSQERMVSTNAQSLADAFAPGLRSGLPGTPWCRGIEVDAALVGFIMMAEPNSAAPNAYLWRLMVDRMHQRRGIGALALDAAIDQAREWGCPALDVSWLPGPGSPEPLYLRAGFVPTGEVHDGEVGGRLRLHT